MLANTYIVDRYVYIQHIYANVRTYKLQQRITYRSVTYICNKYEMGMTKISKIEGAEDQMMIDGKKTGLKSWLQLLKLWMRKGPLDHTFCM